MRHKQKISMLLAAFFAVALIGFSSCNNSNDPAGVSDEPMNYSNSGEFVVDMGNEIDLIEDATLENEMKMNPMRDKGRDLRNHKHKRNALFLGKIFYKMKLDKDQFMQIREFMKEYWQCRMDIFEGHQDERKEIIQIANEKRRSVIEQMKAGEITREEARDAMREISKETRELLRELVDVDAHCKCLLDLFAKIRETLTPDQQAIWDEWVSSLEGPCFD